MTMRRMVLIGAVCGLVAGCGSDKQALAPYVAAIQSRPAAPIEPIPQIASYTPYTYRAEDRRSPFTPTTPERSAQSNSGVTPDTNRPREPLESYSLDALRMVGTITRGGTTYALISAPDNIVHRVRRGNHAGQNDGEIDAVSDSGIVLTEIVPDGAGGYARRPATIAPSG